MRRCATMALLLHVTLVTLLTYPLASAANTESSANATSVAKRKGEKVEVAISSQEVGPVHHKAVTEEKKQASLMRVIDEKGHTSVIRKQKKTTQHALATQDNGHAGVLLDKKESQATNASSLEPDKCLKETGGTCGVTSCSSSRKSTCVDSKCVCNVPDECAVDGKCVKQAAVVRLNLMPSGIGDGVWSADGDGHSAKIHGTVTKHIDTEVDDDGDGNDDHYYRFDGTSGYLAIEKANFKNSKITHMVAEVRARTNQKADSSKDWNDNWSLLDFDRSEWFNIFIRADDGRAMACSTGTAGGSQKTLDELHGGKDLTDNEWHTIKYTFSKEDGHKLYVKSGNSKVFQKVDSHSAFSEAGDSDWVGDGIGNPGTQRFGMIGDGSEADKENGDRNDIWFQGDIKWVKLATGTSVSACESALKPPDPTPAPTPLSDDKNTAHRMYSLGGALFVVKVLFLTMHA